MQNRIQRLIGLITVAMLSTMKVSASASEKSYSQRQLTINGAGATFPFPLIDSWRKQKSGIIVNISSGAGRLGFPIHSAYVSTKFALEGLMAYELEPFGIK